MPLTQQQIEEYRKKYGFNSSLSLTPSSTISDIPKDDQSLFEKTADISGKALQFGADVLINPIGRALTRPGVELVKGVQKLLPGGKTGLETVNTPFGKITPRQVGGTFKEATRGTSDVVDLALTFAPVEKLFTGGVKLLAKGGTKLLKTGGEVLTGVEKSKIGKWFDLAKSNPEKIESIKESFKLAPNQPFLGLAQKISSRFNTLKEEAQNTWQIAKQTFIDKYPNTTFDLSYKVPELKDTLGKFGLGLKQVRDKSGKLTNNFSLTGKGRLIPFSNQEAQQIQGVIDLLRDAKNYTIDDLSAIRSKLDEAYNAVKYTVDGKPKKYHALVMSLKEEAEKFIDGVLPTELKNANKLYRDYYEAFSKIGSKVIDSSGEVKQGAETFLGNIMNMNKGVERNKVIEAGSKLGIDILDEADNLKITKELMESVPNSVRNRTMDILKGIAGATAFVNPTVGIPALFLTIMSSPSVYRNLIEAIAGTTKKLPITKIIEGLSESEKILLRRVVGGSMSNALNQKTNQE